MRRSVSHCPENGVRSDFIIRGVMLPPCPVGTDPNTTPHALNPTSENARKEKKQRRAHRRAAGRIMIYEAVCRCGRYARKNPYTGQKFNAEIRHGHNGAYFSGAITCVSVWMCPVCAANISTQRREEVTEIVEKHADAGRTVMMATFTIPHTQFQRWRNPARCHRTSVSGRTTQTDGRTAG